VEFYDTEKDPFELKNLATLMRTMHHALQALRTQLESWMKQQGDEGAAIDKVYPKKQEAK
jgi:N-sulfoglucosamine sulfohydrolase